METLCSVVQQAVKNEYEEAYKNHSQKYIEDSKRRETARAAKMKSMDEKMRGVCDEIGKALAEMEVKLKSFSDARKNEAVYHVNIAVEKAKNTCVQEIKAHISNVIHPSIRKEREAEQKKLFDHVDAKFKGLRDRMDTRFDNIQKSLSNRINVLAKKVEMVPAQMAMLNQNVNNVLRCVMLNSGIQNQRYQEVWNRIVELTECETDTYVMLDEFAEAFREHIQRA